MAAARRLNTYVTVAGATHPPGEVSDEVADQIENDSVFEVPDDQASSRPARTKKS